MSKFLSQKNVAAIAIAFAMILGFMFAFMSYRPSIASAGSTQGLWSSVSTTTTKNVGPQQIIPLFGTTTRETAFACSARIITTVASPIMIEFASAGSTTVSGMIGHLQPASTTVAYDGGLFGCGYWTAYAFSSTTITVTETR